MRPALHLYNSRTRSVERLRPAGDPVTLYICGVTPYDTTHLGHIFTYSAWDVLVRVLRHDGLRTAYVQNLTDIDDAILRASRERSTDWRELCTIWTRRYVEDMIALNILPPDHFPRATAMLDGIVATTERLLSAGVAYESGGSVFFSVAAWPDYGRLSRIPPDDMLAIANQRGNRADDPRKRSPLDFPLWQAHEEGEPWWPSPWGPGRPGWHIECSTMASHYLGPTIDVHGGGADLIFPHHESEVAQSECATGRSPFVGTWFHTGLVHKDGEKMSKSKGNLIMLRDLMPSTSVDGFRLYMASHHYREPWEHDGAALDRATADAAAIAAAAGVSGAPPSAPPLEAGDDRASVLDALADDLDTPAAATALRRLAGRILEAAGNGLNVDDARATLVDLAGLLGLRPGARGTAAEVEAGWRRHVPDLAGD